MINSRWTSLLTLIGMLGVVSLTMAQGVRSVSKGGDVLHERLNWGQNDGVNSPVFFFGEDGESEGLPEAFSQGQDVIERPAVGRALSEHSASATSAQGRAAEPAEAANDPRGGLGSVARPDRDTTKEGTIRYTTVFEPSLVPFKRDRVLDAVSVNGDLIIEDDALLALPVSDLSAVGSDALFWGAIDVVGRAGVSIPIPSTAPGSRLVRFETTPPTPLSFHRDSADNRYVRIATQHGPGTHRLRLVWLSTAPKSYFGGPVSSSSDLAQPGQLPVLPPQLQVDVKRFSEAAGFDPRESKDALLERLVLYFRSFTPGQPEQPKGSPYLDLALGKKGICRHRAYAFMVTALGLGIRARYVFNEAHVFVEVWVNRPRGHWLRIDLGGSAERLEVTSAASSTRHESTFRDPFGWPPDQGDGSDVAGANDVVGIPPPRLATVPPSRDGPSGLEDHAARLLPPPSSPSPMPDMMATTTSLQLNRSDLFRGDLMEVSGEVIAADRAPIESGFVQLLLLPESGKEVLGILGIASLKGGGQYRQVLRLPRAQAAGRYQLVARFVGSSTHAPSLSH